MIKLRGLTKYYQQGEDRFAALDGVDLDVAGGEFVSIMGPSGSGKSTLLHLIGGLDTPSRGEIYLEGRAISSMSDDEVTLLRRRRISFIFQFFNLLPTLTAEENVGLPLLLDGRRARDVAPRVRELLGLVGLDHRRRHRPDELSGGEMQRVAIARALVSEPAVILADEPTGNLDSVTGQQVMELITRATERSAPTILLVTHDPQVAAHGRRTVTLRDGRVVGDVPNPRADAGRTR